MVSDSVIFKEGDMIRYDVAGELGKVRGTGEVRKVEGDRLYMVAEDGRLGLVDKRFCHHLSFEPLFTLEDLDAVL